MGRALHDDDAVVVGIDFGTLSGRALVVRVSDGAELGSATHAYRHGVIDETLPLSGERLPPDWALQHPLDYVGVLQRAVPAALEAAGADPGRVIGIATDFTASTPLPALADGTPLCLLPEYADRPHAYPKLWKHHAAQPQADRITALAQARRESWLPRYGGFISSEWEFAKALQVLEEDPEIYAATAEWVEAADWIVWRLTGEYRRNPTTAGYKGIHQDGRYPDAAFLAALNPEFADFAETRLAARPGALGEAAGGLTPEAASWTGLTVGTPVAVGNVDAHVTVAAAKAAEPGRMVAIMGTSTCHVMNGDRLVEVPGMCGVVDGGITTGLWGYEAGQSGVGDILAWFVERATPPELVAEAARLGRSVHEHLTELGWAEPAGAHGLVALDWLGGNRSVLVSAELSGLILGVTLATRPEQIYRALVEATAFGTRVIVETFAESGLPVREFIAAGGLIRNRQLVQTYADVLGMPISLIGSEQGPALGSAIHAAVAAGAYPDVATASAAMGSREAAVVEPDAENVAVYERLYAEYRRLHDTFGRGGDDVMRRLRSLRRERLAGVAGEVPS